MSSSLFLLNVVSIQSGLLRHCFFQAWLHTHANMSTRIYVNKGSASATGILHRQWFSFENIPSTSLPHYQVSSQKGCIPREISENVDDNARIISSISPGLSAQLQWYSTIPQPSPSLSRRTLPISGTRWYDNFLLFCAIICLATLPNVRSMSTITFFI